MKRFLFVVVLCLATRAFASPEKKVKVACIGDSITYGAAIEDRERFAYPAQLQEMLGDGYIVGNFGHNGATLLRKGHNPYDKLEVFGKALEFRADVYVIHLGINDTDPRDWPNYRDDFIGDYLDLIVSFREANPEARIIIALLTPLADRHFRFMSGTKKWHEDIQEAIKVVARTSGAELIDFHSPLYPYPWHLPDAIHPDEVGYGMLAKVVYSAVTGDYGGLSLPSLYSDNMVIQRRKPFIVSGKADTGDKVSVRLGKQTLKAVAGTDGTWSVEFPPMEAATGLKLSVSTKSATLEYSDVAVGEVWLCSGQSNMRFRLSDAEGGSEAAAASEDPDLRFFDQDCYWATNDVTWGGSAVDSVKNLIYLRPGRWEKAAPETSSRMSAVGYWFAKVLRDSLKVPVGIIHDAVGGTPAESWIDRNTLETRFPVILRDWIHNDFIQGWARDRAAKNLGYKRGDRFPRHPYEPCYMFESAILPLGHPALAGVVWYQGESNAHNFEAHELLFPLLVDSWREWFRSPGFPFYYVQLSSLNRPSWPWFRDSQRRLLESRPGLGMAVSSDLGDPSDVHYKDKRPVGERLARLALAKDYGFDLIPSGPLFRSAAAKASAASLSLRDPSRINGRRPEPLPRPSAAQEVVVTFEYGSGLKASDGSEVVGFELAGEDRLFHKATCRLEGDRAVLSAPEVKSPVYVRYAWEPFTRANLVNSAGLPASTFLGDVIRF
ncbi:MAG: sialate O-acetylesterase [Bacteroidales bacterium]|nr:sialate O-acetylesterase [Bacteroidales bacterium]